MRTVVVSGCEDHVGRARAVMLESALGKLQGIGVATLFMDMIDDKMSSVEDRWKPISRVNGVQRYINPSDSTNHSLRVWLKRPSPEEVAKTVEEHVKDGFTEVLIDCGENPDKEWLEDTHLLIWENHCTDKLRVQYYVANERCVRDTELENACQKPIVGQQELNDALRVLKAGLSRWHD